MKSSPIRLLVVLAFSLAAPAVALAHGDGHGFADFLRRWRPSSQADEAAPGVARGVVFEDSNRNGIRERHERGISGVSVSNGKDVVQTDRFGGYEIPLPPESILFITKPAGYLTSVDANNLPRYYYIHYPDGTPQVADFQFPIIEPTGPLPAAIDFPLYHDRDESRRYDALVFADPQAGRPEQLDFLREDIVAELIGTRARFGMVVGDVVNDDLNLYPRHNAIMATIGIPIWNMPGNHDMNFESPNDRYATETYKRFFGPTYYSFDYGQVHFVALDNVEYKGKDQGRFDLGNYRGYISAEQLTWLANDLRFVPKHKLILIGTHIPLVTFALDGRGERDKLGDNINTVNYRELLEVLKGFPRVYHVAGHDTSNSWQVYLDHTHGWYGPTPLLTHTLAEVRGGNWAGPRDERGVRDASMQDGTPNGYYVMSFDGAEVKARFKAAAKDKDYQMRIMLDPLPTGPGQDANGQAVYRVNRGDLQAPTKVVVNVWDGGEKNVVEMSLDRGSYQRMAHVLRTDPFLEKRFAELRGTPDAISRPEPSSHIWELPLPTDPRPGVHVVKIRSKDTFGRTSKGTATFEVE